MAGNSICPKTGSVVIGKKGKYEIKNYLGSAETERFMKSMLLRKEACHSKATVLQ